jgi:NAD(P)-dependent dehydrogenase (short-subunit alcohol dehydrogenase family)
MIARALADAGAERVYIAGRRMDVLQEAATDRAGVIVPLYCDITSKASLEDAVAAVERDSGYLHLVVCNAGISGPQVRPPVPGETSLEEWRQRQMEDVEGFTNTFRVNSSSVWFTAMSFLKLLDEGNKKRFHQGVSSQVVVISSIAGFNKHATGGYAYGPSKAAATHIAKMLSNVLPTWGIR